MGKKQTLDLLQSAEVDFFIKKQTFDLLHSAKKEDLAKKQSTFDLLCLAKKAHKVKMQTFDLLHSDEKTTKGKKHTFDLLPHHRKTEKDKKQTFAPPHPAPTAKTAKHETNKPYTGTNTNLPRNPPASSRRCASATSANVSRSATSGAIFDDDNQPSSVDKSATHRWGCFLRMPVML